MASIAGGSVRERVRDMDLNFPNYLRLSIAVDNAKIEYPSAAELALGSLSVAGEAYSGHKLAAKATVSNNGDVEYYSNVRLALLDQAGPKLAQSEDFVIDLMPGETEEMTLTGTFNPGAGQYRVALVNVTGRTVGQPVDVTFHANPGDGKLTATAVPNVTKATPEEVSVTARFSAEEGLFSGYAFVYIYGAETDDVYGCIQQQFIQVLPGEEKEVSFSGRFENGEVGREYRAVLVNGENMTYVTPRKTAQTLFTVKGGSGIGEISADNAAASIYRIDGHYRREGRCVNVELQIKSLVDTFWGEIEHKLVYKNANYYVYDDFMKELLASLKASLTIVDRQMNIIFNEMQDTSKNNLEVTQNSFESLITKGINDIFNRKLLNSVGFSMNIKNTSKILGHYIFLKDAQMNRNQPDRINALFYTFRKLNSVQLDFTSVLTMEGEFASEDVFIDTLGKYLISVLNSDYDWYVFFRMLFAIEPGNNINDFRMFLSVIKNYLVDDYWLNTSFVRLPMEDAKVLQRECLQMLADSLVHIGTIHILHDDKMSQLNRDFVLFVEELEQRTISYRDFMQYREAYHEEWLRRCALIFGRH